MRQRRGYSKAVFGDDRSGEVNRPALARRAAPAEMLDAEEIIVAAGFAR
jgi:hypothetical protein